MKTAMFHLNLVDLDNPRMDRVVLQGFPLKDLKPRCKLWLTLVAEQPAQIAKKVPYKDYYPVRTKTPSRIDVAPVL